MSLTASANQQTRLVSLIESLTNTAVGFIVSLITWYFIVWTRWFDINTSVPDSLAITGIFTVISIIRGYMLRRVFIRFHEFLMYYLVGVSPETLTDVFADHARELLTDMDHYLDYSKDTSIFSGSIFHQRIKQLVA